MSCVVAGLRYYFRIYKYEYLGELMTSKLHIVHIVQNIFFDFAKHGYPPIRARQGHALCLFAFLRDECRLFLNLITFIPSR